MLDSNQKHNSSKKNWLANPVAMGLLTFLLLAGLCSYVAYQRYTIVKTEEKQNALNIAESVRSRLQQSLQYSLSATMAMTLIIDKNGIPRNFDSTAAYLLKLNKYIDGLQLVPNGIITYMYPLAGNETVIGYNILKDPLRSKEALKAIEKRKLFFAGPFELKQGGVGIVGRLPFFIDDKFWGFSCAILRLPTLLTAAGIDTLGEKGYYFQLSKTNPETDKDEYFLPFQKFTAEKYEVAVPVPDGEWKLSVIPVNGYKSIEEIIPIAILGLILSLLGAVFAAYAAKTPARMQKLVESRTLELDKSEKRHKAIVDALPDMLFVIDAESKFIDYSNPMGHKTMMLPEHFIGKKVIDVMPHPLAQEILNNKNKLFTDSPVISHSYQLEMPDGIHFYEARYAPQGKDDALILVRDVTETKKAEQLLKDSEEKYRTLVEQASDAIFIANFKGRFLVVNPASCKLSQYTEEELLKLTVYDLALPTELKEMPFQFEDILAGKTARAERKMRLKDGRLIDVEIAARIIAHDRFLAFVRDISERKKVEKELLKSREDLRQLSNYIENIREEERLHISREIHDELGQQLTVLKMDISRLAKKITDTEQTLLPDINELFNSINDMVKVVRKISSELRPGLLDDLGLVPALDWYSNDFGKRTGIKTNFISNLSDEKLPEKINIGLFRIFQESLTNVARHSDANRVDISLTRQDNQLVLLIEDNGIGFEPTQIQQKTLGIMGMKERAYMMEGTYTVNSTPGKGTIIEVIVPSAHIIAETI